MQAFSPGQWEDDCCGVLSGVLRGMRFSVSTGTIIGMITGMGTDICSRMWRS
jgi:hypothetical protein